ncbi:phosphatidylinositol-specific phospholipase C [Streptomyces sp. NBC_00536]|uniref:phosphatidylinositol-specific phospholipase C n=1 Tax=Streptomyces sp. NBC_00536 TaxID=2975769 RepID=UPI002E7FD5AE|nr:phosphatidylinositol-specific phospholipase C [Streptomyces sp. NBC_00536]WUC79449.1 phosphatidylinositol-specific phospholipase C [Streptomyces sp. NBC_00536]
MSPTRRDVLKWGVGAGAAAAVTLGLPGTAQAAGFYAPDWMGKMSGSLPVTSLTIPGTHDSWCTDPANGTKWAQCQNWGIPEQLERGIRFLDIRLNGLQGAPNEFGLYHGSAYQGHRFQDVLEACRSHFRKYPGETVIMRVKNENSGGQALSDDEFMRRFNYYLDNLGYRSLVWTAPSWPKLGQVRGKIIIAADFTNPWGILNWNSSGHFNIQDAWNETAFTKTGFIVKQFDEAWRNQGAYAMFVNFTSYSGGNWPQQNAYSTLPDVLKYLDARKTQKTHFGIVPMDFPDFYPDIVRLLVEKNFL